MWIGHLTGPCWTHGNWRWLCVFPPCRLFDQCSGSFDFYYVTRSLVSEYVCSFGFPRFSNCGLLSPLPSSLSFSLSLYLSIHIHMYFHHSGPIWSLLCKREIQCRVKLLAPNSPTWLLFSFYICCLFVCAVCSSALLLSLGVPLHCYNL